jgi:UDP-2,3-diacylglucosamine pyrophosphatase LpxH
MASKKKRPVDIVVLSDIHLGTYGCHASELLKYLKSIEPGKLILNGDIIDMWQFSTRYWPKAHMQVIKHITGLMTRNTKVVYLTGNHDEMLRKFAGFKLGSLHIDNKLLLKLNSKKVWIFHGDVFDITMKSARWIAKLGAVGYDTLILLNAAVNHLLERLGRPKISLSKKIKDSVKTAVAFIDNFEVTAAEIAIDNGYDYVVCGHIHKPARKKIVTEKGQVMYLNSGDWVENLTALEYHKGEWSVYHYRNDPHAQSVRLPRRFRGSDNKELFEEMFTKIMNGNRRKK